MPNETRIVTPGPSDHEVRTADGLILQVPTGWELLSPGDAALTRRVKAAGPTWTVQEKKGSQDVLAGRLGSSRAHRRDSRRSGSRTLNRRLRETESGGHGST